MKTLGKRVMAAVLAGTLMLPAATAAEAGPRHGWHDQGGNWYGGHHNHHHHYHGKPRRHRKKNDDNLGAAIAAGVIGLAAGAIILGATSQPSRAAPPVTHYPPAPYPGRIHGSPGYHPWSPAWYRYCTAKYRSFVPETGLYTTYRGEKKFCQ